MIEARRKNGFTYLQIPDDQVHGFRVCLRPIQAGEPTSTATQAIREQADKALARVEAGNG